MKIYKSIPVEESTHREVKSRAAILGYTIAEFVELALRDYMEHGEKRKERNQPVNNNQKAVL